MLTCFANAIKRALKLVKWIEPVVAVGVFTFCLHFSDKQTALGFAVMDTLIVASVIVILIMEFCGVYCVNPKFWDKVHESLKTRPILLRLLLDVKVISGNAEVVEDDE